MGTEQRTGARGAEDRATSRVAEQKYGPAMPQEMTELVMIRLPADLLRQLKDDAQAQERTVAQNVRLAIKSYLGATTSR